MNSANSPTAAQFLTSIENDSKALTAAARKGLDAPVPSCPGWTVRDLVLHTGRIHWQKELIIREGAKNPDFQVGEVEDDLIDWFSDGASKMLAAFRSADSSDPAWTWHESDKTVGFWYRRMAHETLIHRVDGELAHGGISQIDPIIAGDGIDEALTLFIAGCPSWATIELGNSVIRLNTPNRSWFLRFGNYSGETRSGRVLSQVPAVALESELSNWDCEVSGAAAALNLWLWGRGTSTELEISGEESLAERLREVAANST